MLITKQINIYQFSPHCNGHSGGAAHTGHEEICEFVRVIYNIFHHLKRAGQMGVQHEVEGHGAYEFAQDDPEEIGNVKCIIFIDKTGKYGVCHSPKHCYLNECYN